MDPIDGPWLTGYGFSGHKSIGAEPVKVGPLAKVNFLVGRNNHGKSTVMRAASRWARKSSVTPATVESAVTMHPVPGPWFLKGVNSVNPGSSDRMIADGAIAIIDDDRIGIWLDGLTPSLQPGQLARIAISIMPGVPHYPIVMDEPPDAPANVVMIPAFRLLRSGEEIIGRQPVLAAGEGLVEELGRWQSPVGPGTEEYRQARRRWVRLQEFMRDVLEDPEAALEVANNQKDLHVQLSQAGEMLHIDELGDGVKQVLMIAAASIMYDDHLVLLEEPEIHLHAGLQRKLMRFLAEKTNSQYIIATHSAHVLDLPGARIFHVTHDGNSTRVSPAVRASDVQRVCQDLGYMASDLLQANYTIWVEGPSDRIYWRHWLSLVDPDLVEGVHYSVMVYGGYLIDNVHMRDQVDDAAVEDLIHLLQLGRECTVIADSDKAGPDAELRSTILRLGEEAEKAGSGELLVCEWASTVENLVPRGLFRTTVIEAHPVAGPRLRTDKHTPFSNPFDGMSRGTYSKVDIAQRVTAVLGVEDVDDQLRVVVEQLADRVRTANGLAAAPTRA
jgi:putative AbiEii toxin of type IV toxin-antitoxin system